MNITVKHLGVVGLVVTALVPGSALGIQFTEVAAGAGVQVVHDCFGVYPDGVQEQNFYGSGLAWADLNRDGWLDLILVNGEVGSSAFLNNGDGTFDEVPNLVRTPRPAAGTGVALADADNDGDLDVSMVNNYGEPFFFRAAGTGLAEMGERFGVNPLYPPSPPPPENWIGPQSMGTAFGDVNEDGFVDLYVANYGVFQQDMLFLGSNGNVFQRTSRVNSVPWAHGFQPVFWDFDNDGDQDIYVANDFGRNYLFENGGATSGYTFTEVAELYKVSGGNGWPNPSSLSMGVAVGDYDNDLDLDLYVTNYVENALYENTGPRGELWRFQERAAEKGVQYLKNSWGTEFADLDLDGDLDLILTAGWIHSEVVLDQGKTLDDRLYLNDGAPDYTFTDATDASGFGTDQMSGRGLALADVDQDGDLDVGVWYNSLWENDSPPGGEFYEGRFALYRNDQATQNHWLILRLVGDGRHDAAGCNRSAVGARVELTTPGGIQMREVRAGGSYLSQSSLELEFGLGAETAIQKVHVEWLCGRRENFAGVQADGIYELHEGAGPARLAVTTPTRLRATWTGAGMELTWNHAPWLKPDGATVERALEAETPEFDPLDDELVLLERTGRFVDRSADENTVYVYRVTLSTPRGPADPITVAATTGEYSAQIPARPRLGQNYPNPFNPRTTLIYSVPRAMHVKLVIYDLRGRLVKTLVDETVDAGHYEPTWDGTDEDGNRLASGAYIYSLQTPEGSESRRLTLLH